MSRTLFADYRGKLELNLFQPRDEPGRSDIMLEFTPPAPETQPFPLSAADARLFAAALLDYADRQDELADTSPSLPKVQDDDG